ncbi:hypothetical protein GCM10011572_35910 [Pseudoduganella buxea]|uniref:Uncharacterized protein n=1 Tax=Pseudoduganella buxea TaxID=1949069 RepID=A0ABQ1KUB6_9BURK|nr:hypothetical protein GCM10011572_35910 [Pseudoduganella buxea]
MTSLPAGTVGGSAAQPARTMGRDSRVRDFMGGNGTGRVGRHGDHMIRTGARSGKAGHRAGAT